MGKERQSPMGKNGKAGAGVLGGLHFAGIGSAVAALLQEHVRRQRAQRLQLG